MKCSKCGEPTNSDTAIMLWPANQMPTHFCDWICLLAWAKRKLESQAGAARDRLLVGVSK